MTTPSRQTETRHHPLGKTCHHFIHHELTCDQYDELRARAGGCCELCGLPEQETGGRRLVVDHFQDGGLRFVRGMICDRCNSTMSCLDGTKPWGPKKIWETAARTYEARSWQQPTAEQRSRVEAIREERYAAVARLRGRHRAA
ncbi:endonuclease domain-containing protein [Streptomyces sp. NPDC057680]|uniref:endonuclease domain-containing protein n=1 Tax=Streptomyces sp. NPDC057680 TaxID=3346208 RepID=UPI0036AA549A